MKQGLTAGISRVGLRKTKGFGRGREVLTNKIWKYYGVQ